MLRPVQSKLAKVMMFVFMYNEMKTDGMARLCKLKELERIRRSDPVNKKKGTAKNLLTKEKYFEI